MPINTSLDTLAEHYQFTFRSKSVLYTNGLLDLAAILAYFKKHKTFLKLQSIGSKSDDELCSFCLNILNGKEEKNILDAQNFLKNAFSSKLLSIPLIDLSEHYNLSVRGFNICSKYALNDLNTLLLYYMKYKNFLKLGNIGVKTSEELCIICEKILDNEQIKVSLSNLVSEINIETFNDAHHSINHLSELQINVLDKIVKRLMRTLSVRGMTILNDHFDQNITFVKLYKAFEYRSRIRKLEFVGLKTQGELMELIDKIEDQIAHISKLSEEKIRMTFFLETLMSMFDLTQTDVKCYEQNLTDNSFPIFTFLNQLIEQNKLLDQREAVIFYQYSVFFNTKTKLPLSDLANQFNISKERVRQIDININKIISDKLKIDLNRVKPQMMPYLAYLTELNENLIPIDSHFVEGINNKEKCSFSVRFITKILGLIYDRAEIILNDGLNPIKKDYLIKRELNDLFNFDACFMDIHKRAKARIYDQYSFIFDEYAKAFFKNQPTPNMLKEVQNTCENLLQNVQIEGFSFNKGVMRFNKNAVNYADDSRKLIIQILEENGKPMKINDILKQYNEKFDKNKSRDALKYDMWKAKEVFILLGKSSTYALSKWEKDENNWKYGTIKDIVEAYLAQFDEPKHANDIAKYVVQFRKTTNAKSIDRTLLISPDKFSNMKNLFWGLASKEYPSFESKRIPTYINLKIRALRRDFPHKTEVEVLNQVAQELKIQAIQIENNVRNMFSNNHRDG